LFNFFGTNGIWYLTWYKGIQQFKNAKVKPFFKDEGVGVPTLKRPPRLECKLAVKLNLVKG
jgi:hypothetical protein